MKVKISPGALILLAAFLLLLPLNWLGAAILASLVHELYHILLVYLLGGCVREIQIGSRGVVMITEPLPTFRQLLSTLAGPVGSLSLLLVVRWLPRTAICGLIQGLFNLLPLLPLDGGRILEGVLSAFFSPPKAKRIFTYLQRGFCGFLAVSCCLLAVRFGAILLIPAFFLLQRGLFGGTIETISHTRYGYDRITETNPADDAKTGAVHRRRI